MEEVLNHSGDHGFRVEDLLDLHEFVEPEKEADQEERRRPEGEELLAEPAMETDNSNSNSPSSSSSFEIDLPAHDAEELEWVSLIVDDSRFDFPPPLPVTNSTSPTPPIKSKRSKRSRAPALMAATTTTTSSSSSSSSSYSSSYSSLVLDPSFHFGDSRLLPKKPKLKKRGRKPKPPASGGAGGGGERRCTHCGAQKTPQWRAGPQGAKTLCNACGVRYKSGRLLPEYRPACSPTFVSHVHSNSHRRVLEMRREKDADATQLAVVSF